jgi:predicted dienelactone hydrolase
MLFSKAPRSPISTVFAALAALAALGCAGCQASSDAAPAGADAAAPVPVPLTWTVTEPGQFSCGHRVLETTYTPPGGLPSRTIPVHVWYPSNATDGEHPTYRAIFPDKLAWEDAAPAPAAFPSGMPVLVHSHGHKGFAGNSARLMCHAASHGWLAVAPEHLGDTISDAPDPLPLSVYLHRPLDLRAALDLVSALPASDPLAGAADMAHVGMSAHSFGTYTGWAVGGAAFDPAAVKESCTSGDVADCTEEQIAALATDLSEPRLSALVLMAGARRPYFANGGYDAVRRPVLMMSGSLNPVSNDDIYASVSKLDMTWVEVEGGCHQLFGLGNSVLGDPECKALPDEEGFEIVNAWVLAYVRHHVLADTGSEVTGIVEGTTAVSPRARVQHKAPLP